MTGSSPKNNLPEEKKALLRKILTLSGLLFAALGIAALLMPAGLGEILGQDDNDIATILGAAFLLVGISDIAIAHIIFKGTVNHD